MAATRPAPASFGRLIRIADRLGELPAGSAAADAAIHRALGLPGEPRPHTTDEAALRTLLPDGYEAYIATGIAGAVYVRRGDARRGSGLPPPRPVGRHAGPGHVRGAHARLRGTGEELEGLVLRLPSPPPPSF